MTEARVYLKAITQEPVSAGSVPVERREHAGMPKRTTVEISPKHGVGPGPGTVDAVKNVPKVCFLHDARLQESVLSLHKRLSEVRTEHDKEVLRRQMIRLRIGDWELTGWHWLMVPFCPFLLLSLFPFLPAVGEKSRAPAFDQRLPRYQSQPAPIRQPCGTREGPLTAAPFRA